MWKRSVNDRWLELRGLSTKGDFKQVRRRVAEYMKAPGGPPPILPPPEGSVKEVQETVNALLCMICRLMDRTVSDESVLEVERFIKIYLTLFHWFDKKLNPKRKKPT